MCDPDSPPTRLCCGKKHWGPKCPDGKVMCCLCFGRFDESELNEVEFGQKEDVCKSCAQKESDRRDREK